VYNIFHNDVKKKELRFTEGRKLGEESQIEYSQNPDVQTTSF